MCSCGIGPSSPNHDDGLNQDPDSEKLLPALPTCRRDTPPKFFGVAYHATETPPKLGLRATAWGGGTRPVYYRHPTLSLPSLSCLERGGPGAYGASLSSLNQPTTAAVQGSCGSKAASGEHRRSKPRRPRPGGQLERNPRNLRQAHQVPRKHTQAWFLSLFFFFLIFIYS